MLRETLSFLCILALVSAISQSAIARPQEPCILYDESYGATLSPSTDEVVLWTASSMWKVSRTRSIPERTAKAIELSAASNEWEAVQLVVRPSRPLANLRVTCSDLQGADSAKIAAEHIELLRVRYVFVERPTDRWGAKDWWPDPLPPFTKPIGVEINTNQPIWIRVYVPKGTPAGTYTGKITLKADDYQSETPLRLQVYDFELPDRMTLKTAFGFHPGAAFRYQKVTDKQQKRAVLEKYLDSFRTHRISPYWPTPMDSFTVTWKKLSEEEAKAYPEADRGLLQQHALTPVFDWTAWDAEMERTFNKFHFNTIRFSLPGIMGSMQGFAGDTREHHLSFTAYATTLQEHLREKGWLDEAYIYWYDEPTTKAYPHVMAGMKRLKDAAPDLQRMLTEQPEKELYGGVDIWCISTFFYKHEETLARREASDEFWWYLCTLPKKPFPGLFIDHPGTDFRVWLWQTWKYGQKGILIWRSALWTTGKAYPDPEHPQNPYEDTMSWISDHNAEVGERVPWGNGDGRFMYPPEAAATGLQEETILDGPVDTIRWEILRDGVEDYEYLVILQRLLEEERGQLSKRDIKRAEHLLTVPDDITSNMRSYTKDPVPIARQRARIAEMIEKLQ